MSFSESRSNGATGMKCNPGRLFRCNLRTAAALKFSQLGCWGCRFESKSIGKNKAYSKTPSGIDPKNIDRIFDSFFTTKSHGMGMGLSICRSIIEDHLGRLWVSPGVAHGSVFRIQLPALTRDAQASCPKTP
jgi:light-regulated signal transduction histidine kinase (bacteriophytochrome)